MTSSRRLLLAAGAVAVVVRCLFLFLPSTPMETKTIASVPDAPEYVRLARNVVQHRVFSRDTSPPFRAELFRTPVYPLLIAPLHRIPGAPSAFVVGLQVLLSLGLLLTAWKLCLELGLSRTTAGITALLVALSPNLAFLCTKVVTETLFGLLLLLCLLLFNRYRLTTGLQHLAGAGVCSGLMILTRPIASYFPVLLAGHLLVRVLTRQDRRSYSPLLLLLFVLLAVAPWLLRNGRETGRYIVSTAGERNLFLYNAATVVASGREISIGQARDEMWNEARERFGQFGTTESEVWQPLSRVAVSRMARSPVRTALIQVAGLAACFASPLSINPLMVHAGDTIAGPPRVFQQSLALLVRGRVAESWKLAWNSRLRHLRPFSAVVLAIAALFELLLVVFGVIGMFAARSKGRRWLLWTVAYFTLIPGPAGEARFRAPIEPLLVLFAVLGLLAVLRRAPDPGGA